LNNIGAAQIKGDCLFFFDNLAYTQPRIADPDSGVPLRRWVPRLRAGDPTRPRHRDRHGLRRRDDPPLRV
jgi:hypothetical protein